jgi:hypothetical protein
MKDRYTKGSIAYHKAITHQLELIIANPDFNATPQQIDLLKYAVDQTLAGKAQDIKADTIACDVFGRGPDFDKRNDPIVSIQSDQLRRVLKRYYEAVGKNDSIRIDIPKGTYSAVFEKRKLNGP